MAWRPYENLIDGELDNRVPGKVTGWARFYRGGKRPLKVTFDLAGDFHEDIRGSLVRLHNPQPSDRNASLDRKGTYMDGFAPVQRGQVGDMTAGRSLGPWTDELAQKLMAQHEAHWDSIGLSRAEREQRRQEVADKFRKHIEARDPYFCYVDYPYLEWYSDNGRVVLELDESQVEIVDSVPVVEKTPVEAVHDREQRTQAFGSFLNDMVTGLSDENRKNGGDGNVTGVVIG